MNHILKVLIAPALIGAAIVAGALIFLGADRCGPESPKGPRIGGAIVIAGCP